MNTLDEIKTQVFCSQCGFVTSDFIEWGDEFYCEAQCVALLPTPEVMEAEREQREARAMAFELSALMDEVEAWGGDHTSEGSENETLLRIEYLANFISWFYPDLLDKRFQ